MLEGLGRRLARAHCLCAGNCTGCSGSGCLPSTSALPEDAMEAAALESEEGKTANISQETGGQAVLVDCVRLELARAPSSCYNLYFYLYLYLCFFKCCDCLVFPHLFPQFLVVFSKS